MPPPVADSQLDQVTGEDVYEIEAILETKTHRGRTGPERLWLVKWKGYAGATATWEPLRSFITAEIGKATGVDTLTSELIEYEKKQGYSTTRFDFHWQYPDDACERGGIIMMPDGYLVYSCPGKQAISEIVTELTGRKQLPQPPSVADIIELNLGHPNYRKLTPKSRPAAGRYLRVAAPTR